jgi:hypothetical protein
LNIEVNMPVLRSAKGAAKMADQQPAAPAPPGPSPPMPTFPVPPLGSFLHFTHAFPNINSSRYEDSVRQMCFDGNDEYDVVMGKACCWCGEPIAKNYCAEMYDPTDADEDERKDCCDKLSCGECTDIIEPRSGGKDSHVWVNYKDIGPNQLEAQFSDEWCRSQSMEVLVSMYFKIYGQSTSFFWAVFPSIDVFV